MKDEIIKVAKKLVRIKSVTTSQASSKEVLDYIAGYLGNLAALKVYEKDGYFSYLWGDKNNLHKPKILLCGHIDVVPVDKGEESLFVPKIIGKKLIGRGAGDMKGHVAAMIVVYKKWLKEYGSKDVGLLLSSDEERGGFNGVKHVVEKGLKPQVVFIPDGGFDFGIANTQKGPHHFSFVAKGPGGHAAHSFEIDNPVNRMMTFYNEARKKYSIATRNRPWAPTFEMTVINTTNSAFNRISPEVSASFSFRFPIDQVNFVKARKEILALAKKNNISLSFEEGFGEGVYVDPKNDFIKLWKKVIENNLGKKVNFVKMHGATDGRHFYSSKIFGSKNIITTSAITGGHHANNEWIDTKSLSTLADALYEFQSQYLVKT